MEGRGHRKGVRELGIKAARGAAMYVGGNITGSLAVLALLILLARLLSPSDFGVYSIALAFYTLLSGTYIFGVALRKELPNVRSRQMARDLVASTYAVALLVALIVSAAAMLSGGAIAVYVYRMQGLYLPLLEAAALVPLYALFNLALAALAGFGKTKALTVLYLIYAFAQLSASTAFVVMGYGVVGALAGLAISLAVPALLGLYLVAREAGGFARPTKKTMRYVARFSSPLLVTSMANQGPPNFAILLLGVFATTAVVGSYNAAFRFGNSINVILLSASYVLLPLYSRTVSEKRLSGAAGKIYNDSIYYTLLFLLPLVVYVTPLSQPLMSLLFSSKYALAPLYFALIVIGSTAGMFNTYASNLVLGYGDTRRFMWYQLTAILAQLALLFALVPSFSAIGAIFALFIISQVLINLLYIYALDSQFKVKHRFNEVIRLTLVSALLMALLYGVATLLSSGYLALLVNLLLTVVLFPPLAALFGGIRKRNLAFIEDVAASLKIGKVVGYMARYTSLFVRD